jgi:predicted nucleic acid-binding protein
VAEGREVVVVDASTLVDLLVDAPSAAAVKQRLRGTVLHAPAHMDAEALSAMGRMYRAGDLPALTVQAALERLAALSVTRHPVSDLALGAWARRDHLRLVDALYVELAARVNAPLLTLDHKLARACTRAEAIATTD